MMNRNRNQGFTLVELVVAMALASMLGVMAYGLFGVSSDNLVEVDSLEATSSRGRFAIGKLRKLFQNAGSQATPYNVSDPFVALAQNIQVAGVRSYGGSSGGWQDEPNPDNTIQAANNYLSFDGVVLTGAYDYPMSFQASGFEESSRYQMRIMGDYLGMEKLFRANPFSDVLDVNVSGDKKYFPNLNKQDWSQNSSYRFLHSRLNSRLIRLTDPLGYIQFVAPAYTTLNAQKTGDTWGLVVPLEMNAPLKPIYKTDNFATKSGFHVGEVGLNLASNGEGDRSYEAAFIDTFWLHVVPSDSGAQDMILVLDRVCGADVAATTGTNTLVDNDLESARTSSCVAPLDRKMIADRVVDFQIWFDCANMSDGDITGNDNWTRSWDVPGDTGCMQFGGASYNPGLARVAHVRLTLRTDEERPNFIHDPFMDEDGNACDPTAPTPACSNVSLRSYDINPGLRGAAPVITFQTDVAMKNFIIRDLR